MALWLASDHLDFRGETAVANGWRERARRLLSGLEAGPEHGWLALLEGALALEVNGDPAAGREFGAEAAGLGVRLGLIDLQMLGLAELRRRQGNLDEAEHLLEQAPGHPLSVLGRAHLALDRRDAERAADLAERTLRTLPEADRTGRGAWLEVVAHARATLGDHDEAAAAAAALRAIAEAIGTDPLRASASFAEGVVTAATGDHQPARRLLEDATDLYARCRAPFETARSRIELAGALHAIGRTATAIEELGRALSALRELGAVHEAARPASVLSELGAPIRGVARSDALTTRQLDVLRPVAEGLPDKEIARRLVLSEHTVPRHIANILTRFGVPSRAAAVAQAKELALL